MIWYRKATNKGMPRCNKICFLHRKGRLTNRYRILTGQLVRYFDWRERTIYSMTRSVAEDLLGTEFWAGKDCKVFKTVYLGAI